MSKNQISGIDFKNMIVAGSTNLANHSAIVDKLNVFPVPDGDTGKNMTMTFSAGAKKAAVSNETSIGVLTKALSRELLMGARGNSGVILSQLFRGFAMSLEGKDVATVEEIAIALDNGVKAAYKAVMKPVEGTILTVARESAEALMNEYAGIDNVIFLYEFVISEMKRSLDRTPDLLPVLKEAGVVDSGGQGLVYIFEGFLKALKGEIIEPDVSAADVSTGAEGMDFESDEFGYCTEFIVRIDPEKTPFKEHIFRGRLESLGDSIVVVQDEDLVKVHVHTLTPGDALNLAQNHGEFLTLKIENMAEQHSEAFGGADASAPVKSTEKKEFGVIAVVSGDGVRDLFKESGCDYIIEGGQTMNPSTEDFIKAIDEVNAKNIIILPNNSNIIMSATQAKDVAEGVNVTVIPTKTIPQGYVAMAMFNEHSTLDVMETDMLDAIANVKSGSVTYAVRDTNMNGVDIKQDDFIGILDKDIVVSTENRAETSRALLDSMIDEDMELVTIIYGEDVSKAEAEKLAEFVESKWEDVEVSTIFGNQPVYSYVFAVE